MKQVEYYKNGNRTLRIKYEGIKKLLEKKDKEIERLNNIINELEEELKWQRKVCLLLNESFAISRIDTLINKLQELKGSESNDY